MREIRLALLEADVNFKVVKSFTSMLKERCLGSDVLQSLDPGQQVVKIVNEELAALMGGAGSDLAYASGGPTVILMAGLQGSGKTTACAKLARYLQGAGRKDVALAACDVYRPAAVEQLVTVGGRAGAHVYEQGTDADPVEIAAWALERAREERRDALIVDTAGRLHVDTELMDELARIRKRTKPDDVLLVVDAMTGQPILFASTGEKLEAFERLHPDRMASRILGMGDVLSLIEKAEQQVDEKQAENLQRKLETEQFTLEDFLQQMRQVRKMGPLSGLIGMLPGMGAMKGLKNADVDEGELDRVEAIILSMTTGERADPHSINGSRRKRIANGSGTKVQHVKQLVKQFDQMRVLMKQMATGKPPTPQQIAQMQGGAPRPKIRRR